MVIKWKQFKQHEFTRDELVSEHMKTLNMELLWDEMSTNDIEIWDQLQGMSQSYDSEHVKFDRRFCLICD